MSHGWKYKLRANCRVKKGIGQGDDGTGKRVEDSYKQIFEISLYVFITTFILTAKRSMSINYENPGMRQSATTMVSKVSECWSPRSLLPSNVSNVIDNSHNKTLSYNFALYRNRTLARYWSSTLHYMEAQSDPI